MSLFSLETRFCSSVRSASLTGVTRDQWWPTGQCCNLHHPNRSDFIDAAGIQIVVNRWPLRQRTTTLPPRVWARSQRPATSSRTAATITRGLRRRTPSARRDARCRLRLGLMEPNMARPSFLFEALEFVLRVNNITISDNGAGDLMVWSSRKRALTRPAENAK